MKVILKQDVPKLGLKGELKEVSPGYARNYLFSQDLAEPATKPNLAQWQRLQEAKQQLQEKQEARAHDWAKSLSGKTFSLNVEVGEKGQLFQAVDAAQIAQVLTEEGFSVEKDQIMIEKPIKELGESEISVKLAPEITAKTKLKISAR